MFIKNLMFSFIAVFLMLAQFSFAESSTNRIAIGAEAKMGVPQIKNWGASLVVELEKNLTPMFSLIHGPMLGYEQGTMNAKNIISLNYNVGARMNVGYFFWDMLQGGLDFLFSLDSPIQDDSKGFFSLSLGTGIGANIPLSNSVSLITKAGVKFNTGAFQTEESMFPLYFTLLTQFNL